MVSMRKKLESSYQLSSQVEKVRKKKQLLSDSDGEMKREKINCEWKTMTKF